jgi:hypothetical protein
MRVEVINELVTKSVPRLIIFSFFVLVVVVMVLMLVVLAAMPFLYLVDLLVLDRSLA